MARRSPNSNRPVRPSSTPAKRKGIPLSALAQRMQHDLQLAGRNESPGSQEWLAGAERESNSQPFAQQQPGRHPLDARQR
ncbi:MAG: hypothetical protein KJ000_06130 [Pirellulaceae bacterium]|nr:hypothetical protein [Pirellulaceae bacterium]